jgi:predicted transposase YbfD/YdcC
VAVVLAGVILALLSNRDGNLSSLWRHMRNNYAQLLQHLPLENYPCGVVSRPHLPILLSKVCGTVFDRLIFAEYGVKLSKKQRKWFAIDSKELKGSIKKGEKRGEAVVQAVEHETQAIQGQNYYAGNKESEIEKSRELIKEGGLLGEKVSFDALHCNPKTLAMMAEKGSYVVGLKGNQEKLQEAVNEEIAKIKPIYEDVTQEKQCGRVEVRKYEIYDLQRMNKDVRWETSQIKIAIRVRRKTTWVEGGKETVEESLYLSNKVANPAEVCRAIRRHWQVEVNNNVRDTTLAEDKLCVKEPTINRVMAGVRTLVLALLRKTGCANKKEQMEDFGDNFRMLINWLKSIRFL